jgi:hypothetical protein
MKHIVFLVEEPSMKTFLNALLPRLIPKDITYDILAHEGITDLERSIPRKLRAYYIPGYELCFIILRDQHGGDCREIKRNLQQLCMAAPSVIIRIVCRELESWYLGDLQALEKAFDCRNLAQKQLTRKYREPDNLTNAADLMRQLVPGFVKSHAEKIAACMELEQNCSKSFGVFLATLNRIILEP